MLLLNMLNNHWKAALSLAVRPTLVVHKIRIIGNRNYHFVSTLSAAPSRLHKKCKIVSFGARNLHRLCTTTVKRSTGFDITCQSSLNTMANPGDKIVPIEEANRFMVDCMTKVGVSRSHAQQLAEVLVAADVRGHYSHGLNRLDMYVGDVQKGVCEKDGSPKILNERAGCAWVDGNNLLGPVVGNFCMDLAIQKAKDAGVGWVVAKGSNHFGIVGWYCMRAIEKGFLGMAFTNTSPIMFPTRASQPALGTNPLCLAAKASNDTYVLDMATSTVAIGKVEIAARKNQKVPDTWGADSSGHVSQDPKKILGDGGLLPLGGSELSGGYKGYGLASMVEIFCGILGGAHWGPHVRKWKSTKVNADLGQCFIAIDPDAFAPGFPGRMQEFIDTMRNMKPAGPEKVLVAGDPENQHIAVVNKLGGIPYHPNQIDFADNLSKNLSVPKMNVKQTV